MDPSLLAGVVLFAAFLPGPSDLDRFPDARKAAAYRAEFVLAGHDASCTRLSWQNARCDEVYKPLRELELTIAWCAYGELCWDAVVVADAARYGFSDPRHILRFRWLALAELWNLLGPLDYAAGRMPAPPRRNRLGHWVFD